MNTSKLTAEQVGKLADEYGHVMVEKEAATRYVVYTDVPGGDEPVMAGYTDGYGWMELMGTFRGVWELRNQRGTGWKPQYMVTSEQP